MVRHPALKEGGHNVCLLFKGEETASIAQAHQTPGFQSRPKGSETERLLLLIPGGQGPALWNWYVGHHQRMRKGVFVNLKAISTTR